MILSQLSPIRFFDDPKARIWDRNENSRVSDIVIYPTGVIPQIQIIVDYIQVSGQFTWKIELYNKEDEKIDLATFSMDYYAGQDFAPGSGEFNIFYYSEIVFPNAVEGYYYLKLTNEIDSYYSDMFGWINDLTGYIKVDVSSANLRSKGYVYHMADFSYNFYLSGENLGIKPKITQEGKELDAITNIIYGSRAIVRELDIDANESIYIFLSSLGLLLANGAVNFSFDYQIFTTDEIYIEAKEDHGDGLYQVKISFVDEAETISMSNG
jgi:hypothetical protein